MRIYFIFIVLTVNGENGDRIETLVSVVQYRNVLTIEMKQHTKLLMKERHQNF